METNDLVYVGFNRRVAALNRRDGSLAWSWKASKGSGYVATLLADDVLVACVNGYTYGLDPRTGDELWFNELDGFGVGAPTISSIHGQSMGVILEAQRAQRQASQSAGHG